MKNKTIEELKKISKKNNPPLQRMAALIELKDRIENKFK